MREIKFRAWDSKNNEWYRASNAAALTYYGFSLFGECTLIEPPRVADLPDLEIMQFTGLKDKNGVEIYEGDILRGDYGEQEKSERIEIKGKVYFKEGSFSCNMSGCRDFVLSKMAGNHKIYFHDSGNIMNRKGWYYIIEDIEVIGNIFESPELLGEE